MMWIGTGTISQEEVKAAINSLMVTNEVKAALRQMQMHHGSPINIFITQTLVHRCIMQWHRRLEKQKKNLKK